IKARTDRSRAKHRVRRAFDMVQYKHFSCNGVRLHRNGKHMTHKPWLPHYDPGVPHEIDVPQLALPELLATAARLYPDAPAMLFYGRTITYVELDRLASRFAVALVGAGIQPGDRIVLVLPNVPQVVICYSG